MHCSPVEKKQGAVKVGKERENERNRKITANSDGTLPPENPTPPSTPGQTRDWNPAIKTQ